MSEQRAYSERQHEWWIYGGSVILTRVVEQLVARMGAGQ